MNRAAMLVVHGIGEQAPLATLDRVVRGLRTVLGARVLSMSHVTCEVAGQVASGVRFDLDGRLPRSRAKRIDVFEGYWAPQAANQLGARGVLAWLRGVLLAPFRNWASIRLEDISLGRRFEIVAGELAAAVAFLFLITAQIAATIWLGRLGLSNILDGYEARMPFFVELAGAAVAIGFLMIAVSGTVIPFASRAAQWARRLYVTKGLGEAVATKDNRLLALETADESNRIWSRSAWAGFVPMAAIVVLIEWLVDGDTDAVRCDTDDASDCVTVLSELSQIADQRELWIGLIVVAGWGLLANVLRTFVADIAVYLAEDVDSAAGALRTHILDSIVKQLRSLLDSGEYDTVHIVSHSLGTVISYDALNQLRLEVEHNRARAMNHADHLTAVSYDRIGSLITVACPLDHLNYAARSTSSDQRPIQEQLVTRRTGLRRRGGQHDAGPYHLDEDFRSGVRKGYYPREPERFAWLNVNGSPDPVGTPLLQYLPDDNRRIRYAPWLLSAHAKIMNDRRTYELMLPYL